MTYSNNKQRGFTLIELLVVIGIIAALAAVVIPNVSRFMGSGEDSANQAEAQNVQSAIDLLITDNGLAAVTAGGPVGTTAGVWATTDFDGANLVFLYPDYMRQDTTKCDYTWDAAGQVTAQAC